MIIKRGKGRQKNWKDLRDSNWIDTEEADRLRKERREPANYSYDMIHYKAKKRKCMVTSF